ncbi:glycoside hydrolase [Sarocladium strictum]
MSRQIDFNQGVRQVQAGNNVTDVTQALLEHLTEDEKLGLLHGDPAFWRGFADLFGGKYTKTPYSHGRLDRLGIPGIQYSDGPRGVNINHATVFPCSTARGATWDPELEERIAQAIGREARVYGANCVGSVCINLPRHPAWGRVQETYGEDPFLLGELGAAHVRGLQENVMACVKHFALNSMETARFRVNVTIDEAALHEVFLPHFKRCVDEGALSIMTAYNSVNGEWAGESIALIRNILREKWNFSGLTITDWLFGLRDGVKSVKADLDIECPFQNRRKATLRPALDSKELSWSEIDRIARRILHTQLKFYASRQSPEPAPSVVFGKEHRELARTAASRTIVLLKNEPAPAEALLPLSLDIKKYALVGRHADSALTGDRASSWVQCPEVTSPYSGLKEQLPNATFNLSASRDIDVAVKAAKASEVAIVVVGYDGEDEGEFLKPSRDDDSEALALLPQPDSSLEAQQVVKARIKAADPSIRPEAGAGSRPEDDLASRPVGGDRKSVRLPKEDVELIRAVAKANPRTVVSIITAGAVIIDEWKDSVPTILISWYNGCENGGAFADVLTGKVSPSGRIPWSMPKTEAHLPPFDQNLNEVTYDKWFGQRMLDKMGVKAAYPLGYGLTYTTFKIDAIQLEIPRASTAMDVIMRVKVENQGTRVGRCVIQIYGCPDLGPGQHDFPNRLLAGFQSVELVEREAKWVEVKLSLLPFRQWRDGHLALTARSVLFQVGQYAGDENSLSCRHYIENVRSFL